MNRKELAGESAPSTMCIRTQSRNPITSTSRIKGNTVDTANKKVTIMMIAIDDSNAVMCVTNQATLPNTAMMQRLMTEATAKRKNQINRLTELHLLAVLSDISNQITIGSLILAVRVIFATTLT